MKEFNYSVIAGTGSFIPTRIVTNNDFLGSKFYDESGQVFKISSREIIEKFQQITGILERRYVTDDMVTSDIAFLAAENALQSSHIEPESLDYIIVAHNFGDVKNENKRSDFVPSIAARVKEKLRIKNPKTVTYDIPFGCPGWLQGMVQADYYIRSGDVHRCLIIGAETLSRIADPHDRDSMLYSDGAGATILEAKPCHDGQKVGILSHASRTDTYYHARMLWMGKSNNPHINNNHLYLKMNGRKLYEYALRIVPAVVKESLDRAELTLDDIHKIFLHQANQKMDEAILERLFDLYDKEEVPRGIMPMTISWLGNSSVATIPTLLDLVKKEKFENQRINEGDVIVFASVGAGMSVNSMVYQM